MSTATHFHHVNAILTDIEGTCTSLSFVKDTLFPYSRETMANFVAKHADDPEIAKLLRDVAQQLGNEQARLPQLVDQLQRWIDEDQKIPALKAIQGFQWQYGYQQGDFTGHLYQDAYDQFQYWRSRQIDLYVYSSGSIKAQKLLFSHSTYGDISDWFAGFFDTGVGKKTDTQSYQRIAAEISQASANILFLSDITAELDAAHQSGMQVACLQRSTPVPCNYFVANDFNAIHVSND